MWGKMKYIISTNGNRFAQSMFSDLIQTGKHIVWDDECWLPNPIFYWIHKIHLSKKINNVINFPAKDIWIKRRNYWLKYPFKEDESYHVILFNTSLQFMPISDIKAVVEKKSNIKISLVLIDSMHKKETILAEKYIKEGIFSNIVTFDRADADNYGFTYSNAMYSAIRSFDNSKRRKSDIYFIGYNKGRGPLLIDLYRRLSAVGVNCDFTINGSREEVQEIQGSGVITQRDASYYDVVSELQGTNCILEILQDGQCGTSWRYYEAVCYNKKLLTNNRYIKSYPYYDPRYMKYFRRVEDIDPEWVKNVCDIDYGYKNDFSPLNLLDLLK